MDESDHNSSDGSRDTNVGGNAVEDTGVEESDHNSSHGSMDRNVGGNGERPLEGDGFETYNIADYGDDVIPRTRPIPVDITSWSQTERDEYFTEIETNRFLTDDEFANLENVRHNGFCVICREHFTNEINQKDEQLCAYFVHEMFKYYKKNFQ